MFKDTPAFNGFSVNDIPAATKFYGETLGLNVTVNNDMEMAMLDIHLSNGGEIMVYPKPNHEPATYTVLNFKVDDIDAAVAELVQKGVAFEHYDGGPVQTDAKGIARGKAGFGPSIAWFKDPAGNILSVLQEV